MLNDWLENELALFIDDSSVCAEGSPTIVMIMGGVAAGKTTIRRKRYSHGYVALDAADIFLNLCEDEYLDFPSVHEEPMQIIGHELAFRALSEKHNVVCELIGDEKEPLEKLFGSLRSIGYRLEIETIMCKMEQAIERNEARGNDNISCYFTQQYHMQWITDVVSKIKESSKRTSK